MMDAVLPDESEPEIQTTCPVKHEVIIISGRGCRACFSGIGNDHATGNLANAALLRLCI